MGDRANILVLDSENDSGVYLYTHWSGTELPYTLRDALSRKQRWNDTAYLARIIFCEMVRGQERSSTGFGISTFACDGRDRVLIINCHDQTVQRNEQKWSFNDYINLTDEQLDNVWYNKV